MDFLGELAHLNLGPGVSHYYEMTGVGGFFSEIYKKVAEQLSVEAFENLKNTGDDFDRIKILWPYCKDMPIGQLKFGKNHEEALKHKNEGNAFFAKHENCKALTSYNIGIIKCPHVHGESRKLLTLLIANRSACLFDLSEFEKTLVDIDYIKHIGSYPEELTFKLFLRKAKCYSKIADKKHLTKAAYKKAIHHLKRSKLDSKVIETKILEITKVIKELENCAPRPDSAPEFPKEIFVSNPSYPHASEAVTFGRDEALGCFAVAAKDIEVGTIIIDEPAYCAVVADDYTLTNCQYCMQATDVPIACQTCANVVYCSLKCLSSAYTYHRYECGLHAILFSSGASINCRMALRIITQRSLDFFEGISEETENKKRYIQSYLCESFHDYYGVYRLCRNEEKRSTEEYVQYTIMAIYLLLLLKTSSYFNIRVGRGRKVIEIFIGSLILQHLQAFQFNAHEISELREAPPGPMDPKDEPNFKAIYIGGGLFTTLAMFNHSCDPSIVRYNIRSNVIVKTVKPIKKGEMIYENYGPIYTNSPREERRKFLSDRYWFICHCQGCKENWPEFKDMVDTEVKIPCCNRKCGDSFYLDSNLDRPRIQCEKCLTITDLFVNLRALSVLEILLPRAEELYKQRKYGEAMKLYLDAIKIYFKNTVPPFPDWVKVQQRLRTCMVSKGNKSIEYIKVRGNE